MTSLIIIILLIVLIVFLLKRVYDQEETIKGHRETIAEYKRARHGGGNDD